MGLQDATVECAYGVVSLQDAHSFRQSSIRRMLDLATRTTPPADAVGCSDGAERLDKRGRLPAALACLAKASQRGYRRGWHQAEYHRRRRWRRRAPPGCGRPSLACRPLAPFNNRMQHRLRPSSTGRGLAAEPWSCSTVGPPRAVGGPWFACMRKSRRNTLALERGQTEAPRGVHVIPALMASRPIGTAPSSGSADSAFHAGSDPLNK